MKPAGYVFGSGESGARFGTAISDIGDIDGDGFNGNLSSRSKICN